MNKEWVIFAAPITGWLVAQSLKYVIFLRKDGLQFRDLYLSGGMPSSHTAFVVSLATYIGATDGWTSHLFVLAAAMAAIVMYDAIGVRRSVGEQGLILKNLSKKHFHRAMGHSPNQVVVGLALGVTIGLLFSLV